MILTRMFISIVQKVLVVTISSRKINFKIQFLTSLIMLQRGGNKVMLWSFWAQYVSSKSLIIIINLLNRNTLIGGKKPSHCRWLNVDQSEVWSELISREIRLMDQIFYNSDYQAISSLCLRDTEKRYKEIVDDIIHRIYRV